ncbi:MAG TPA: cell wall-binding repeat-containing protein [Acidothermaceae bacterium]|jgi:putative cell wall-binding protein
MRKAFLTTATGVALSALLTTSVVVALSASASTSNLTPAVTPIATTQINATPLTFARTNGDILAINKVGPDELAIGGNFTNVIEPESGGGTLTVAATDFAVISELTGQVVFAGQTVGTGSGSATNGYVRAINTFGGVTYIGGDFTSVGAMNGSLTARNYVAALDSSFNVTAWAPAVTGPVRAIASDASNVYVGGDLGFVEARDATTGALVWQQAVTGGGVHALLDTGGFLYVGGLFETYGAVTQHGLVKVNPSNGSVVTAFNANLRADEGTVQDPTYGDYDGEEVIALSVGPSANQILLGIGGHAPVNDSSNETILTDVATGARLWKYSTRGDSQAVGSVGDTAVAGYHNSTSDNPLTAPNYFGIQLDDTNSAVTSWNPAITGSVNANADGGNGGVQAIYVDQSTNTLYMGGAFIYWNNQFADTSLIAFSFTPGAATAPGIPAPGTAMAGDATASVNWTAPYDGGSPITGYTVTSTPATLPQTTTGATTLAFTGLTDGVSYKFKITATNGVGTSSASVSTNSVTPAPPSVTTTTTTISATPGGPATVGASIDFTATVAPSNAVGSVQFMDGSSALGAPVSVSGGTADLTTTALTVAIHSITATFTPTDSTAFSASGSSVLSYEVDAVVSGSTGSGGGPAAPTAALVRVAGADRFLTAVATMNAEYPSAGSAGAVVLARADNYPDALVGTALAAAKNAPLLFVQGSSLTPETQAGIVRVLPSGGTVYLLGGTAAIPDSIATKLTSLGFNVVRYAGTDRYDTALKVAAALGSPSTVFLATGTNFPDALSAGPAAAEVHGVVLLTNSSKLTTSVEAYLTAHPGTVYAVGGPAVAADPAAIPLDGADRYATAAAVATAIFSAPTSIGLASGVTFPDALSGGAYQAHSGGPILLGATTALPSATADYLSGGKATITNAVIFGGVAALSASVQSAIAAALGG